MSVTPPPDDDDRTVRISAPTDAVTPAEPPASRPLRMRLRAFSAVAGIMLLAMIARSVIAGGAFSLLRGKKPLDVSSQQAQEVAAPQVKQEASPPAPPPTASTADRPFSPRQMLNEIFEGRDRGHSVTASVDKGAVRISSARPGYVYVLAAGSDV